MEDRNQQIIDLLGHLHFFDSLKEDQLQYIADNLDTHMFTEGEIIFEEGSDADGFYIIFSGRVKLTHGFEEEEEELSIFQQGDYFGEEGLLTGQTRMVNAIAFSNVIALHLDSERIEDLADHFPQIIPPIRLSIDSYQLFLRQNLQWRAPREAVQFISRKHNIFLWLRLAVPLFTSLITMIPLTIYFVTASEKPLFIPYLMGLVGIGLLGWMAWNYIDWANDYAIITNRRVVALEKVVFIYESRQEAPLDAVLSVATNSSQIGRIIGYGNVVMRTYTGVITFQRLANHELVARLINEERQRAKMRSERAQKHDKEDLIRNRLGFEERKVDPFEEAKPKRKDGEAPRDLKSGKIAEFLASFFHLRDEENGVITYRTHWFILLKRVWTPTLIFLILFLVQILAWAKVFTLFPASALGTFFMMVSVVLAIWWIYQYWDWRNDRYIVGQDQLVDVYKRPLGQEQKKAAPVKNIQTVEFERLGLISLILNYGTVFIRVGDTTFTFDYVYNPSEVQREIFERYQEFNKKQKDKEQENLRNEMAEWIQIYHQVVQNGGTPPPAPSDKPISGYNIGE